MNLPTIDSLEIAGKRVLVRGDVDVDPEKALGSRRVLVLLTTVKALLEKNPSQIIVCGHRGRPKGKEAEEFSLKLLEDILKKEIGDERFSMLENTRFNPGEESNSVEYAKELAEDADVYVNEAFASSHREHASIVGVPHILPHAAGLRFAKEVETLSKVRTNAQKPVVAVVSGLKEDKLDYAHAFAEFADTVLIAGRLPEYLGDEFSHPKMKIARLVPSKEDITLHSVELFESELRKAGTIILSGPVGKYEEEGYRQSTQRVFQAAKDSSAYIVAGGGDTEKALSLLGMEDAFDWVSVGGGAMLDFLAQGTLPGIDVLLQKVDSD